MKEFNDAVYMCSTLSPPHTHVERVGYLLDSAFASSPISSTVASQARLSTTARGSEAHSIWYFNRKVSAVFLSCVLSAAFHEL